MGFSVPRKPLVDDVHRLPVVLNDEIQLGEGVQGIGLQRLGQFRLLQHLLVRGNGVLVPLQGEIGIGKVIVQLRLLVVRQLRFRGQVAQRGEAGVVILCLDEFLGFRQFLVHLLTHGRRFPGLALLSRFRFLCDCVRRGHCKEYRGTMNAQNINAQQRNRDLTDV